MPQPSDNLQPNKLLEQPKHGTVGPIIAILLILALLIFGALYFLNQHAVKEEAARNNIPYIPSGTTTVIIQQ